VHGILYHLKDVHEGDGDVIKVEAWLGGARGVVGVGDVATATAHGGGDADAARRRVVHVMQEVE
jgi:hypothetical protein